jgi:hypothetical protein
LSIALEPECAAIYCTKLPLDKMDVATGSNERTNIAAPGQTLMIVDMGGKICGPLFIASLFILQ